MLDGNGEIEDRLGRALQVVLTGLEGREQMTKEDIDGLRRELQALMGDGRVRVTSGEQLKADVDRANKALAGLRPRLTWVESYICNNKAQRVCLADGAASDAFRRRP